MLQNSQCCYSG